MQNRFKLIIITFFIISCKSTSNVLVPEVEEEKPVFEQYGTPFANVPDRDNAVIYQVNMRPFSAAGNFQGVLNRIDSIKALGVNVIYLMPIYPVGKFKAINSPYCVQDYVGVNPEFGTLTDLRAIVDAAHSKNMAVILDWVANHTSYDNTWISAHPDWYLTNSAGQIQSPPGTGWNDVAQLSFSSTEMRQEMIKSMKYWVYTANIDGFRCDYSDGPPSDFWQQALDSLRKINSHKLLMLAEGTRTSNFTVGFDFNFGFGFFDNLKKVIKNGQTVSNLTNLNTTEYNGATGTQQVVRYITNHDVNGSDGSPISLFGGKKGSMAAFVLAAYMKSVPMIYNGQEVGTATSIPFPFTSVKINWTINPDVTQEYKKVISLRNTNTTIRKGSLKDYSSADICAFTKILSGDTVLVISNLRNTAKDFDLPLELLNRSWKYAFKADSVVNFNTSLSLPAYDYTVLLKK